MKQSKNSCTAGMRQGKLLSQQLMVHRHTCTLPLIHPTHTHLTLSQSRSPFMGVENKLKDWMLDLMGKYCYDMICSARKRPAACPRLPLFQPPSMMQASVINVLTCIIDAWHYDNGSKSTHGEEGARIVWSVWGEGIGCRGKWGDTVWLDIIRPTKEGR